MTSHRKAPKTYPERPASPIRKISCARGCGYQRPYTDAHWYLSRVISHPVYGEVTGEQLVQHDLWNHDCDWYLERRERAREILGRNTSRVYSTDTPGAG